MDGVILISVPLGDLDRILAVKSVQHVVDLRLCPATAQKDLNCVEKSVLRFESVHCYLRLGLPAPIPKQIACLK